LFTLLSANVARAVQYCCVTKETQQCCTIPLLRDRVPTSCCQGNLTCYIAPSLRLLVPSSLQVWRHSAYMSHYHLRTKVALDLVDHVVDPSDALVTFLFLAGRYGRTRSPSVTPVESIRRFWRASTRSLASCSLLRASRSRSSGAAAATTCTLRHVTRR
jgi:hypothetical protein